MVRIKKPLPFAGERENEKVLLIRKQHHKEFRPRFVKAYTAFTFFLIMIGVGSWFGSQDQWWGSVLVVLGVWLTGHSVMYLIDLSAQDDRTYFLKCIAEAENEYELDAFGFNQYEHMENLVFKKLRDDGFFMASVSKHIKMLHEEFDLRKLADEIEESETLVS